MENIYSLYHRSTCGLQKFTLTKLHSFSLARSHFQLFGVLNSGNRTYTYKDGTLYFYMCTIKYARVSTTILKQIKF